MDEKEYFKEVELLSFHTWGNGDFDCISLDQNNHFKAVYFMNHSPDNTYFVTQSISDWIQSAIEEIEKNGVLFHPMDYQDSDKDGLYKQISKYNLF